MGNKFTRRRPVVDERFTRPQGLYQHRDVDHRRLRRLILDSKLAPCFPGAEDPAVDLDECPICFLFYPSLNRSKCCTKGICTECFLQIKSPHSARPTQCPFCKTSSYAVEYRGARTVEEKGIEQAEEQKVIEAKIRIRQKELHDEEERLLRREEDSWEGGVPAAAREVLRRNFSNLHGFTIPPNTADIGPPSGVEDQGPLSAVQDLDSAADSNCEDGPLEAGVPHVPSDQVLAPAENSVVANTERSSEGGPIANTYAARVHGTTFGRFHREDDFDLDLEDIMVMEAIWLSIQEQGSQQQPLLSTRTISGAPVLSGNEANQNCTRNNNLETVPQVQLSGDTRDVEGRSSVTGGLAGAIAALAERQALSSENGVSRQVPSSNDVSENDLTCMENSENSMNADGVDGAPLGIIEPLNDETTGECASSYTPTSFTTQLDSDVVTAAEQQGQIGEKAQTEEIQSPSQDGGQELSSWIEVSVESGRALSPHIRGESRGSISDWMLDHSSEAVEVGTSFSSSVPSASELPWEAPDIAPQNAECTCDPPGLTPSAAMLPESFEEQMMLAMALSLAEAQAQARRL